MVWKKFKEKIKKVLEVLYRDKSYLDRFIRFAGVTSVMTIARATQVYAEGLGNVATNIRSIFNPIVELLASVGYPATYAMIIVGGLMTITGRKTKGIQVIKWACVGYLIVQFTPFVLNILEMIGYELRNGF